MHGSMNIKRKVIISILKKHFNSLQMAQVLPFNDIVKNQINSNQNVYFWQKVTCVWYGNGLFAVERKLGMWHCL